MSTIVCVYVQVWEGMNVVATGRKMLGETHPVSHNHTYLIKF